MATDAATPPIDKVVRSGRRSMLRRIIRMAGLILVMPRRSTNVRRYRPGDGGRIASAGARRTVAMMALSVPSTAVATVMPTLMAISHAGVTCGKLGNWNDSAYSPVNSPPSQSPKGTPISKPMMTIASTSFR